MATPPVFRAGDRGPADCGTGVGPIVQKGPSEPGLSVTIPTSGSRPGDCWNDAGDLHTICSGERAHRGGHRRRLACGDRCRPAQDVILSNLAFSLNLDTADDTSRIGPADADGLARVDDPSPVRRHASSAFVGRTLTRLDETPCGRAGA